MYQNTLRKMLIDDESMIEALANSLRWRIIDRNGLDHNSLARASDLFEFFSHEPRSIKFHNLLVESIILHVFTISVESTSCFYRFLAELIKRY